MFLCARCSAQVVLCRRCERGQIYCGRACATAARRAAQKEAGQRYQTGRPGRFAHAARARRYRASCKIVTHQGSDAAGDSDLLAAEAVVSVSKIVAVKPTSTSASVNCACCGARCAAAVRIGFVRHHRRAPDCPVGDNRTSRFADEHFP
jgi:hypothetical protein